VFGARDRRACGRSIDRHGLLAARAEQRGERKDESGLDYGEERSLPELEHDESPFTRMGGGGAAGRGLWCAIPVKNFLHFLFCIMDSIANEARITAQNGVNFVP
jgi:hypothetical protein